MTMPGARRRRMAKLVVANFEELCRESVRPHGASLKTAERFFRENFSPMMAAAAAAELRRLKFPILPARVERAKGGG